MPYWRTSTFQNLQTKIQSYMELLTEEMAKKGFQRSEKSDIGTFGAFLKGGYSMFETPDKKFNAIIQAIPCNGELKVGFTLLAKPKQNTLLFISFIIGLLVSLVPLYIIKYVVPFIEGFPLAMLWLIIWFSIGLGVPLFFSGLSVITWNRKLMQILVRTAESMGSKQITPFKRTWPTKM